MNMRYAGYIDASLGYDYDPYQIQESAIRHGVNLVHNWIEDMNEDLDTLLKSFDEDWDDYVPDAAIY